MTSNYFVAENGVTRRSRRFSAFTGCLCDDKMCIRDRVKPKRPYIRQFREDEMLCFRVLTDYLHLLEDWKVRYAPKTPDNLRAPAETQQSGFGGKRTSSEMSELSPQGGSEGYGACEDVDDRFVEACQMHCHIEYMADVLTVGDLEERVALVDELMKEGKITFLQEYITRKKKEVAHHGEEPENV